MLLVFLATPTIADEEKKPKVAKEIDFEDLVDLEIARSNQKHDLPLYDLDLNIPDVVTSKAMKEWRFLRAEVVIRPKGRPAQGILGFRRIAPQGDERTKLTVSLTKEFYKHSTARVYYTNADGDSWILYASLSKERTRKAQQGAGGKRE